MLLKVDDRIINIKDFAEIEIRQTTVGHAKQEVWYISIEVNLRIPSKLYDESTKEYRLGISKNLTEKQVKETFRAILNGLVNNLPLVNLDHYWSDTTKPNLPPEPPHQKPDGFF